MKKIILSVCLMFVILFAFGCGSLTFDDILYQETETTSEQVLQYYTEARNKTLALVAEYTTTIITKTPAGTQKQVLITTVGKIGTQDYASRKTMTYTGNILENGEEEFSYQTITYYDFDIYTEDNDGIVTVEVGAYNASLGSITNKFFTEIIPSMGAHSVEGVLAKTFEEITYHKLNMSIREINDDDNFIKPEGSHIDDFSYEIGISDKKGYLEMYRTNTIAKINVWEESENSWQTVFNRVSTTILTSYGKENVFIEVPTVS